MRCYTCTHLAWALKLKHNNICSFFCQLIVNAKLFEQVFGGWSLGFCGWVKCMRWVVVGGVGAQRIRPPPVLSGENLTLAMCLKSIVIHLLAQGKRVSRFFLQILLKSWKVNSTASTLNILLSYLLYIIAKEWLQ